MSEIQVPTIPGQEKSEKAPGYTVVVVDAETYNQYNPGDIYGEEERPVVEGFYDKGEGRHALVLRNN